MDNENVLITVATLTYNNINKLYRTIDSVLMQDYPYIEYIISDDGSEVFPENEIKNYIEKNQKGNIKQFLVLSSKQNTGTVRNINRAYEHASGTYIYNLSAGDLFFEKNTLSKLTERFAATGSKVITASRLACDQNGHPLYYLPHLQERAILQTLDSPQKQYAAFVSNMFYDMASGSAMYFDTEFIKQFGLFDTNYTLWEDGPFLAKYLLDHQLCFAYDIVSVKYELGGVSTGKKQNPLLKRDTIRFDTGERMAHMDRLTLFERRCVKCERGKITSKSRKALWFWRILFFDVSLERLVYSRRRARAKEYDEKVISGCKSTGKI